MVFDGNAGNFFAREGWLSKKAAASRKSVSLSSLFLAYRRKIECAA
jgi:hypothetical protein